MQKVVQLYGQMCSPSGTLSTRLINEMLNCHAVDDYLVFYFVFLPLMYIL